MDRRVRLGIALLMVTASVGAAAAVQLPPVAPAPTSQPPAARTTAPRPAPAQAQAGPSTPTAPLRDELAPAPEGQAPVELPPPHWTTGDVQQLLAYIQTVAREGLTPQDYRPDVLAAALAAGESPALDRVATDVFNQLSTDLALGHVRGDNRINWHVVDNDLPTSRQRLLLEAALASHRIAPALTGLLPVHPQYGALRHALEVTPRTEVAKINRIRLNMDRWRWLPRDLGQKYIIVNVPSFHATLVEDGKTRWKNRAIAGAIKTQTPNLSVMATGVILNPWWEVPTSISHEVAGKPGYVAVKGTDGKVQRWRQPPGPSNALGQLKFVMLNPQSIYLHDTNARSRFNSEVRALSHGCIRTQHVVDLATELLGDDGGAWDKAKVQATLASKKTVEAKFVKPVPVYIVYFSAAALLDGTIVQYDDLYRRDDKVIAALLDSKGGKPQPVEKDEGTQAVARPTGKASGR